jgi:hypothetical protein
MCKCKKKYALQHDKCKCTKIGRVTVNDLKLTLDLHTTYTTIDTYSHKAGIFHIGLHSQPIINVDYK